MSISSEQGRTRPEGGLAKTSNSPIVVFETAAPEEPMRSIPPVVAKKGTDHPEWVGPAQYKVAETFKDLFARSRTVRTVYRDLFHDIYERRGRTVSMVAIFDYKTENEDFAGHMRFLIGKKKIDARDPDPIEAIDIMSPPGGWDQWLDERKISPDHIGEFGRLCFATTDKTKIKEDVAALRALRRLGFRIAREEGITDIFAIMPGGIAAMFRRGGYEPTEIEGATLNDNAHVKKLLECYPGYWIDRKPRLYHLPVPQK